MSNMTREEFFELMRSEETVHVRMSGGEHANKTLEGTIIGLRNDRTSFYVCVLTEYGSDWHTPQHVFIKPETEDEDVLAINPKKEPSGAIPEPKKAKPKTKKSKKKK